MVIILILIKQGTVSAQSLPPTYQNPGSRIKAPNIDDLSEHQRNKNQYGHTSFTAQDVERQMRERIAIPKPGQYAGKKENQKEAESIINEHLQASRQSRRWQAETEVQQKKYDDALQTLKDMLSGKKQLSIAGAYYTIENAYGKPYMGKEEFLKQLKESAEFIKAWLQQNNYSHDDAEARHYGIQKFMSEELSITQAVKDDNHANFQTTIHKPFHYDYEDFSGEKDFRNFFVTKLSATGTGQCNSMPAMYLCLAEALNTEAYLSFAPQHSFIKYKDAEGVLHNYEPTSNWHITDRWYQDNMFISAEAKRSGIFLDTANSRQLIANCMVDLAHSYMVKFDAWDEKFIADCITSSKVAYPRDNNINTYFVYSRLLERKIEAMMYKNKVTKIEDAVKIPECQQLISAYRQNERKITELGYRPLPEKLYKQMMEEYEFKSKLQKEKSDSKKKRALFLKYDK